MGKQLITSVFSGGAMSSKKYHSEPLPPMQEVDLNDAAWNEVVSTRLPANLEAQARQLKAWKRKREVRSVDDLLRALLVYASCQYSFKELGAGRMEQVQVTDRHQAESLKLFELRPGDLVVTDAGYPVGSSVEMTQQQQAVLLQRSTASHLHMEDEQGQTISLKER